MRQGVTADQMMKPLRQVGMGRTTHWLTPGLRRYCQGFRPYFHERFNYARIFVAPIESRPRQQLPPPALDARRHSETVEFDLMQPLRSWGSGFDELGRDPTWKG